SAWPVRALDSPRQSGAVMGEPRGPWDHDEPVRPPPPAVPQHRRLIWAGLIVGLGALVWALAKAFPEEVRTDNDWSSVARAVLIGKVNGQRVRFIVDTGATDVVLSPDDARRLGLDVGKLAYIHGAETANGVGYGAEYVADSLEVGPIAMTGVKMTVNQAPMSN